MAVNVVTAPAFSAGAPALLFERRYVRFTSGANMGGLPQYDVSSDGKRLVVLDRPGGDQRLSIHVVHN